MGRSAHVFWAGAGDRAVGHTIADDLERVDRVVMTKQRPSLLHLEHVPDFDSACQCCRGLGSMFGVFCTKWSPVGLSVEDMSASGWG